MKFKKILSIICCVALLLSAVYVNTTIFAGATDGTLTVDFATDTIDVLKNIKQPAEQTDTNYLKVEDGALQLRTFWSVKTFSFDYVLEPNTEYKVTWERNITKNVQHSDRYVGFYRLPDSVVDDAQASVKNAETCIKLIPDKETTSGYEIETFSFITRDFTDENNRFGLITVGKDFTAKIKSIKIERIGPGHWTPDSATYDFSKDTIDVIQNIKQPAEQTSYNYLKVEGGALKIRTQNEVKTFNFDFELAPNTRYKVTWERRIPINTQYSDKLVGFYRMADRIEDDANAVENSPTALKLIPNGTLVKDYETETFKFTTPDFTDEYNLFGMIVSGENIGMLIKSITIEKIDEDDSVDDEGNVSNFDFSANGFKHITNKKPGSSNDKIEQGDGVLNFSISWSAATFTFRYKLKPNTMYKVTWEYQVTSNSPYSDRYCGFYRLEDKQNGDGVAVKDSPQALNIIPQKLTTEGFTSGLFTFKTDDLSDGYDMLGFVASAQSFAIQIKNLTITPVTEEELAKLITNGDFEKELNGWSKDATVATASTEARSGNYALNMKGGYYATASQGFIPEKNQSYEISFWYKGKTSGINNWSVAGGAVSFSNANALSKGALESSDDWRQVTTVVSSGDEAVLFLAFRSAYGDDYLIDDITVTKTDAPAEEPLASTAPTILPLYTTKNYEGTTSLETFNLYISSPEDNLITDYSFENGTGNWNKDLLFGNGLLSVVEDSNARTGKKVLKFEAHDLETPAWSSFYVDVEPNTEYYFVTMARGELWSDTNTCDLHFGIADYDTGKFLTQTEIRGTSETKQLITCFDGDWHSERTCFNSGDATRISIAFYGANSTAYFDDMYLFKAEDKIDYEFPYRSIEGGNVTNASPAKKGANAVDNLFRNVDLSDITDSFWNNDSFSLNGLSISDTGSRAYGNAIYYSEATYYTGKPKQSYYFKWIDVEPNTEYTFSADYVITKKGDGWFGMVTGNKYIPGVITKTNFSDKFTYNYNWNTASYTFNTGGYDRVGFVLCDKGGAAYIDNLTLVKASEAIVKPAVDTSYMPQKITSSSLTIKNSTISVSIGTSINSIKTKLNDGQYLRAFENSTDGAEITDLSVAVKTGNAICLMDGPTVFDRVVLVVKGDIDGDGKCALSDLEKVMKYSCNLQALSDIEKEAADVDNNGIVDVNDIALLCGMMSN